LELIDALCHKGRSFQDEKDNQPTRGSFQDEKDNQGRHEHDRPKLQKHEISLFNSTPFILLHVPHCFNDQLMWMTYCFCSKPLSKTKWSVRNVTRQIIKSAAETGFSKVLKDASPPSINQQIQNGGSTGLLWEIRRHQLRLRILVHITTVHRRNNFQRKAQHSAHRSAGHGCSASAFSVPGKLFNRRRHHYVFNGIIVLGPVTGDNS
jgi:hypothetical protein